MEKKRSIEELTDDELFFKRQTLRAKLAHIELEQTIRSASNLERAVRRGMKKYPINPKLDEWIANWDVIQWEFEDQGGNDLGRIKKWILTVWIGKRFLKREYEEGWTDNASWDRSLLEVHNPEIKSWPTRVCYGDYTNGKISELIKELGIADFCTEQEFCTMCHRLFDFVDAYNEENDEEDFKSIKMKLPYEKPEEQPQKDSTEDSDSE